MEGEEQQKLHTLELTEDEWNYLLVTLRVKHEFYINNKHINYTTEKETVKRIISKLESRLSDAIG